MNRLKTELHYPAVLVKRILVILWLYTVARCYFYFSNRSLFPDAGIGDLIKCSFYGLRFDLSAIVYTNLLFILLHILPFGFRDKRWYQVICKVLFYAVNGSLFIIMICDAEYYKFSLRHGTVELLDFMADFIKILPAYIFDFWYLIPITLVFFLITEFFYRLTKRRAGKKTERISYTAPPKRNFLIQLLLFPIMAGASFLLLRGGLQGYPLSPIHAGKYVPPSWTALVINTPFSIIHSIFHKKLDKVHYFEEDELLRHFQYVKQPMTDTLAHYDDHVIDNIFIIIMESYSAEYTGLYGERSATPFLDSLSKQSLVFTRMNANGMRSIDGVPAILAGIPAQLDESFLSSVYQANNYKGLAAYLGEMGYSTSYFHGGHNGTFNLDNFAYASGFKKYYGKNEYEGKPEDYCHWGIYDEPFFLFTVDQLNKKTKTPFLAALFSLSSHHPYEVPKDYAATHPQFKDPMKNSVRYADHSLESFFREAQKQSWFKNTLFIITADHCGPATDEIAGQKINRLHIPLLFYHPTDSFFRGVNDKVVQHIDIMPTVLDYVRYPKSYCAFGSGIFRTEDHYTVGYVYGYQYIMDQQFILEIFDGKVTGLYELMEHRQIGPNIMDQHPAEVDHLFIKWKAFQQTYTNALIENKMIY